MSEKKASERDERTRNWSFVLYPESAPNNWHEILDRECIPWIESPLHEGEADVDGSVKKAHWHICLIFPGKKSFEQIKEITDRLNAPIPQKVANVKGLVRYMVHMDNPEKKQYSKSEIIGHGGADVASYLKASGTTRYQMIAEMCKWVEKTQCVEFFTLFNYAESEHFDDWFPLLCDNSAYIMGEYIKSRRNYNKPTEYTLTAKEYEEYKEYMRRRLEGIRE